MDHTPGTPASLGGADGPDIFLSHTAFRRIRSLERIFFLTLQYKKGIIRYSKDFFDKIKVACLFPGSYDEPMALFIPGRREVGRPYTAY